MYVYTLNDNLKILNQYYNIEITDNDIDKLFKHFGLEKQKNNKVQNMSGGQKQRLSIIRTFIQNKDIIICDEPTGNLDLYNSKIFLEELLSKKENKVIIMVSHDNSLFRFFDVVLEIKEGKLIEKNAT